MEPDVIVPSTNQVDRDRRKSNPRRTNRMRVCRDPISSGFVTVSRALEGTFTDHANFTFHRRRSLKIFREPPPDAWRVGFVFNPKIVPNIGFFRYGRAAAVLGMQVDPAFPFTTDESSTASGRARHRSPFGVDFAPHATTFGNRELIVGLAARHRLPGSTATVASSNFEAFFAFGNDAPDLFPRAASYIDRILRRKPFDLPVQLPTKLSW